MPRITRPEKSGTRKHGNREREKYEEVSHRAGDVVVHATTAGCLSILDELRGDTARAGECRRIRRRSSGCGPLGAAIEQFADNDVRACGMGPAVAIGTGEFHIAVAPGLALSVSREKQPFAGSAGRNLAGADALYRLARDEFDGVSLRCAGDGRARTRRSAGCGGLLQPGCGAQSAVEQSALRGAVDVAPGDCVEREKGGG